MEVICSVSKVSATPLRLGGFAVGRRSDRPLSRSEIMARVHSQNTKPEMIIRRGLHACGYRYRLHRKDLPGKPDLVLRKYNACVFIHGCFWHGHPGCGRMPSTRQDYWQPKIARNAARDIETTDQLLSLGWRVLVVWECAITGSRRLPLSKLLPSVDKWLKSDVLKGEITGNPVV